MTDNNWAEDRAKQVLDSWSFDPKFSEPLQTLIAKALLEANRDGFNRGIEKSAKVCDLNHSSMAEYIRKLKED